MDIFIELTGDIKEFLFIEIIKNFNWQLAFYLLLGLSSLFFLSAAFFIRWFYLKYLRSERGRKLLSNAGEEAIIFYKKRRILDFNQAILSLTGYEKGEFKKKKLTDLLAPSSSDLIEKLEKERVSHLEVYFSKKDGTEFLAEVTTDSLALRKGSIRIISLRDVTETRDIAIALEQANWELVSQKTQLEELFKTLELKNKQLEIEREKSERLLLNILPARVARDLKTKGKSVPKKYDNVTVYFSDIVGFTKISQEIEPEILIAELNELFTFFDKIMFLHNCERIKTIGDAYLAVCGLPIKDKNHADNIMAAAIKVMRYLKKRNQISELKWQLRIGIHSGSLVGGVVGTEKYIYDVFGDTINTASRMESYSEPMKINLSEETYSLLAGKYKFIKRNLIEVKGKGEMQMYFLKD